MLQRLRFKTLLLVAICLSCILVSFQVEAADAGVAQMFDASTPPALGGNAPPTNIEGGLKTAGGIIEAVKAKRWWFAAGGVVFILMLILQLTKLRDKMGKAWTWIVAGGLSVVAALLFAFDETGFSWETFLSFCTAGPTIAWGRGFVKKAILNFKNKPKS